MDSYLVNWDSVVSPIPLLLFIFLKTRNLLDAFQFPYLLDGDNRPHQTWINLIISNNLTIIDQISVCGSALNSQTVADMEKYISEHCVLYTKIVGNGLRFWKFLVFNWLFVLFWFLQAFYPLLHVSSKLIAKFHANWIEYINVLLYNCTT